MNVEARPEEPQSDFRVIVRGLAGGEESQSARKAYARALVDVFFAKRPLKSSKELEMVITFTKE
ncbi:hypothetical protein FCV25MIE_01179, partial [Fagus crenata]